jgi:hypothetical protein
LWNKLRDNKDEHNLGEDEEEKSNDFELAVIREKTIYWEALGRRDKGSWKAM